MRLFAEQYPDKAIVQALLAQLTWYHNITLLEKVKEPEIRLWYAQQVLENGWSRNIMLIQIENKLYQRQALSEHKTSNFHHQLPSPQSELAHFTLKDSYIFDFLTVGQKATERAIEKALMQHITQFLLELGAGFAFVGQQYHLEIAQKDFYLDLLFYHLKLRCYVVVELKAGDFAPEHAGKLNFYLSAVDDVLRGPQDNPSIGLLLCKTKDKLLAEYALKDVNKPIGISEYQIIKSLPEDLKTNLPSIEELEQVLSETPIRGSDNE